MAEINLHPLGVSSNSLTSTSEIHHIQSLNFQKLCDHVYHRAALARYIKYSKDQKSFKLNVFLSTVY